MNAPDERYAPIWWTLTPEQRVRVAALDEAINAEQRERLAGLDPARVNRGVLAQHAAQFAQASALIDRLTGAK